MSAIFGVFRRDRQPVDPIDLVCMGEILAHRGPDGCGIWNEAHAGLGHRALNTTPEALHEKLPVRSADGGIILVSDARLDNRPELFDQLGIAPSERSSMGDGEIIQRAWRRWGEETPDHLVGDFAFAIVDTARDLVFCARDRMGVRPFYYFLSERLFAFGTESKALLCLEEVPRDPDEMRIASHLLRTFWDRESTFYSHIRRLPPATAFIVTPDNHRQWCYWQLDPTREIVLGSDGEYADQFRDLFTEAVRCRLRSPDPAGSLLSGGLDSSSVTCVARDIVRGQGRPPIHSFSGVFDQVTQCDERQYIAAAVNAGNLVPHHVQVDAISPLVDLPRLLFHLDEPFFTPHISMDWALFRAAADAGVRVVLDGMDGDSAVGHGFGYQTELALSGRLLAFYRAAREMSDSFNVPVRELIWRRGIKPAVPDRLLRAWHLLRRRRSGDTWFNPEFADRIGLDRLDRRFMRLPSRTDRQEHFESLTFDLIPYALESQNRTSAAFGVENRHPFFDTRLLEFTLAIPATQKIRGGVTRLVLRNALADVLPREIRERRGKTLLGQSFTHKLLSFERERLEDLIERPGSAASFVDRHKLREVHRRFSADSNLRDGLDLWVVLMLRLGLDHMTEGAPQQIADVRRKVEGEWRASHSRASASIPQG